MKRTVGLLVLGGLFGGCASVVDCQDVTTVAGIRTYCVGKVAGDGQEAVFRDVHDADGGVFHSMTGGSSLWGQVLSGTGQAAVLTGGLMGAAALYRPDRDVTQTSVAVEEKAAVQSLAPEAPTAPILQESPAININNVVKSSSTAKSTSKSTSRSKSTSPKAPSSGCKHHCGSEQGPGDNIKKAK